MVLPVISMFEHEDGSRLVLHSWRNEDGQSNVLSSERRLMPGTGRALAHRHLDFAQRFAVRSGRAALVIDGKRRELATGEEAVVAPGVPHVDAFNDSDEPAEVYSTLAPGPDFAFGYGYVLGRALREGEVNRQRELHPLHLMVVLRETRAQTYAAGIPVALQRYFAIPLAAWLGRALGFRGSVS